MKVLVICNDFPPKNTIGAQRPYSWYKYLPTHGIETIVVTKNWGELKNFEINDAYSGQRKIIYAPNKLHLSDRIILKYGVNRLVWLRKMLSFIIKSGAFFIPAFDHQRTLYKSAKEFLERDRVDLIVCTGEPFILFKYGYKLSRKFKIKWIADFRDGWYHNHISSIDPRKMMKLIRIIEKVFEKKYLNTASQIVTVDPLLAAKLKEFHQKEIAVIYNGFDEIFNLDSHLSSQTPLILIHSGTLTPGQRVEFLLQAIQDLYLENKIEKGDVVVRFIGLGEQMTQKNRIERWNHQIAVFLSIENRLPRDQNILEIASADILLTFTESHNHSIFAKNYDYMSVQRPIWILPNDNSILRELLVDKLRIGKVFSQNEELKKELLEMIQVKKEHYSIKPYSKNEADLITYTRAEQAKIFAGILKNKV
jgi:hypothetical protein